MDDFDDCERRVRFEYTGSGSTKPKNRSEGDRAAPALPIAERGGLHVNTRVEHYSKAAIGFVGDRVYRSTVECEQRVCDFRCFCPHRSRNVEDERLINHFGCPRTADGTTKDQRNRCQSQCHNSLLHGVGGVTGDA